MKCVDCVYPCKTCITETRCTECGYDHWLRLGPSDNCKCKPGYYEYISPDETKKECRQCIYPCVTCDGPISCHTFGKIISFFKKSKKNSN